MADHVTVDEVRAALVARGFKAGHYAIERVGDAAREVRVVADGTIRTIRLRASPTITPARLRETLGIELDKLRGGL